MRTRALSESELVGERSGCLLESLDVAFSCMCARRREEVGERGAKTTDLLLGREGD